ncbi:MAG TPA: hypothetical protein VGO90_00735 [Chthoniobacteraceae bacterium]|nr:hypothetical protein [Chthoniobacteraceae bacterium]
MKAIHLILTGAVGLLVGALAGVPERRTDSAASSPSGPNPSAQDRPQLDRALAFPSDNARIVRLFSALQEPLALKKRFQLFEALRDLTAQDLPALARHVESFAYIPRSELLPTLVDRWFELDFEAAQSWMLARPKEFMPIKAWATVNPEAALREALAMQSDWRATSLLGAAISQLAGEDPAAQAARLRTLPRSELRDGVFQGVLAAWAKIDPAAAYASLAEIPPGQTQDAARDGVLREWAERDPAAALAQINVLLPTLKAGVLGNELITDLADRIGKKNPQLALEWLSTLPVEFRDAPAIAAARGWAVKEPAAALEWCVENGVDVARGHRNGFNGWQAGVLGEALAAQPAATIAWLEVRPAGPDRDRLLERALEDSFWRVPKEQLFDQGTAFAMRLFEQLPPESQERTATALGRKRAEQGDLTDLGVWAQNFASGPARANAVAGAIGAAYERDASRVETLLASTASTADRDAALRGLAETMSKATPAGAAIRALTITDSAVRRETLDAVVTGWLKRDPETARTWLRNAAAIPEAWKQTWK